MQGNPANVSRGLRYLVGFKLRERGLKGRLEFYEDQGALYAERGGIQQRVALICRVVRQDDGKWRRVPCRSC